MYNLIIINLLQSNMIIHVHVNVSFFIVYYYLNYCFISVSFTCRLVRVWMQLIKMVGRH